ncbi:MAG: hypothetical protein ACK56F_27460, partial [bacterium]
DEETQPYTYSRVPNNDEFGCSDDYQNATKNPGCIAKMDRLDKEISSKIHKSKVHIVLEVILLVFASLFNRSLAVLSFFLSYLYARNYTQML